MTNRRVGSSVPAGARSVAGSRLRKPNSSVSLRTLEEALAGKQIIDIDSENGVILAEPAGKIMLSKNAPPSMSEIGSVSPSPFTAWLRREYNPELRDLQGLRKYDEMWRSDSTVRATVRAEMTPILTARWFVKPASESAQDQKIANFISWNLFEGMTISWGQVVYEALLMLKYGWYMFEKVFTNTHPDMPNKICWQKFAPRHPMDVVEWSWDDNGGPAGVELYNPVQLASQIVSNSTIYIPIEKLAVCTYNKEAGDMTGVSLLRSAYKPWYYKMQMEKIDAIQKERHGIGVPIITLPVGFNDNDKVLAEQIGRNLRTNERAHVVMPPGWTIEFAKLQGQLTDALKSIEYHSAEILRNILAAFIDNKAGAPDASEDLFLKSCRYVASIIEEMFNVYCIPQLVKFNWANVHKFPKLVARRIGEVVDQRTFSFALRNNVGAGIVVPDDPLEDLVRDEMDLPPIDRATRRAVAPMIGAGGNFFRPPPSEFETQAEIPEVQKGQQEAAQGAQQPGSSIGPPRVGLPRQTNPPTAGGTGTRGSGADRSGG
jgi:hypothetical protein